MSSWVPPEAGSPAARETVWHGLIFLCAQRQVTRRRSVRGASPSEATLEAETARSRQSALDLGHRRYPEHFESDLADPAVLGHADVQAVAVAFEDLATAEGEV